MAEKTKKVRSTKKVEKHIVKRRGHKESYDERKVYGSVYSACMSAHLSEQIAEKVSAAVCKDVNKWIKNKPATNAHQLYAQISTSIKKYDKNAAFMYETHMDVS